MKVLLVNMSIDQATGGGTANRTIQIAKSMKRDFGIDCLILATDQGLDEDSRLHYNNLNTVILPCLIDRFYVPLFSWSKLRDLIEKVDIIHITSHWTLINVVVYLLSRKLKKPYTFCPAGTLKIFGRSSFIKKIYNLLIGKSIVKKASRCIAITDLEKEEFLELGIQDKLISIIKNGIDGSEFYPDITSCEAFKSRFGLCGTPYILYMGRLNLIKGPDILLDAYIRLLDDFPEIHLVFAGPDEGVGDQLKKVIKYKSVEKKVHLIGYIGGSHKVGAYTGAKFLVVPSRREAMSIVALEAGACGIPVILTTECGFDDVKDVGSLVVKPVVDDLYNGMHSMLSSSYNLEKLGNDLRNLILERYTWLKTAEQYIAVSNQIVR